MHLEINIKLYGYRNKMRLFDKKNSKLNEDTMLFLRAYDYHLRNTAKQRHTEEMLFYSHHNHKPQTQQANRHDKAQ